MFKPTKSRTILIGVALGLLLAEVSWLLLRRADVADFQLEATQQTVMTDDLSGLAIFNADQRHWIKDGKFIPSLVPFLHDDDPMNIGPDGIGMAAAVRLQDNSSLQAARQAYLLLASEGVCQVALFSRKTTPRPRRFYEAPVLRLIAVRGDDGRNRPCVDRVNGKSMSLLSGS